MNQLDELIEKINAAGRPVLVVELHAPDALDSQAAAAAKRVAWLVKSWTAPNPQAAGLFVTGQPLVQGMFAILERSRAGGQGAAAEFEQALDLLPMRRRQYSAHHRWTLYDANPYR